MRLKAARAGGGWRRASHKWRPRRAGSPVAPKWAQRVGARFLCPARAPGGQLGAPDDQTAASRAAPAGRALAPLGSATLRPGPGRAGPRWPPRDGRRHFFFDIVPSHLPPLTQTEPSSDEPESDFQSNERASERRRKLIALWQRQSANREPCRLIGNKLARQWDSSEARVSGANLDGAPASDRPMGLSALQLADEPHQSLVQAGGVFGRAIQPRRRRLPIIITVSLPF